jgi:hypothetical protein
MNVTQLIAASEVSDQQAASFCESHHGRHFIGEIARDFTPIS